MRHGAQTKKERINEGKRADDEMERTHMKGREQNIRGEKKNQHHYLSVPDINMLFCIQGHLALRPISHYVNGMAINACS